MVVLTILRASTEADSVDAAWLQEILTAYAADVRSVRESSLASAIVAARVLGAVVVLVASAEHATRVLSFGADEVVRIGELTAVTLTAAVERALARGEAREKLARAAALQRDDASATFSLLVGALGHHLHTPLCTAQINCDVLTQELVDIIDAFSYVTDWAALEIPLPLLRRLAMRRQGAVPLDEVRATLDDLKASVERMVRLAADFRAFARDGTGEGVHVGALVRELEDFLRGHLGDGVELVVEISDSQVVAIARPTMVSVLGALLSQAIAVAKETGKPHTKVCVRTFEHDGMLETEIEHDGVGTDVFDAIGLSSRDSVGLAGVRRRASDAGGELLIDSDARSTRYRLLLPLARLEGFTVVEPAPSSPRRPDKNSPS